MGWVAMSNVICQPRCGQNFPRRKVCVPGPCQYRCIKLTSPENRYVKNTFDAASASTIGASFLAKKVVVDDCLVRLQVSFPTDHLP